MKIIGLIGGMSWESTVPYYRHINEAIRARLGGLHSARIVLASVDFHDIETLQRAGDWEQAGALLAQYGRRLHAAGAECLVLCTNTMHKVAPAIEAGCPLPLLHIADPTAQAIRAARLHTVGLLGTRFTMEQDFYRDRLAQRHGLTVLTPEPADRAIVHRIIYEELCVGVVSGTSRAEYRRIIGKLAGRGAQGVILGCTEIGLLVGAEDTELPLFDTAAIHAKSAAGWALGDCSETPGEAEVMSG